MHFLYAPKKGSWVAASRHLTEHRIKYRLRQAQACLSDLDDTDAVSPGRKICLDNWLSRSLKVPRYRKWLLKAVWKGWSRGNSALTASWKEYVEQFLGEQQELERIRSQLTEEAVLSSLYPGVQDFYRLIRSADKYYVTRNIALVAEAYGRALDFRGEFAEVEDKGKAVEHFLRQHPRYQRYIVKGDSAEDFPMVDVLRFYEQQKKIDYVISIYRADEPLQKQHGFGVEVGKDYRGLVELLER